MKLRVGELEVRVYASRADADLAAGRSAVRALETAAPGRDRRVLLAAAPSQLGTLHGLARSTSIDWPQVQVFQIDEYVGLAPSHPATFARFLRKHLIDRIDGVAATWMDGSADPTNESARYGRLVAGGPIDLACLGVGENGHLAFNEPGAANPNDSMACRTIELDLTSRSQQVHDGTFGRLEDVPTRALTLTIPTLLAASTIVCLVHGERKRQAIERLLWGPIDPACPASFLRRHARATLYLDSSAWSAPIGPPTGGC